MQRRLVLSAAVASSASLIGCASTQVGDYASQTPTLDLAHYFNGTVDAHGMFQDRSGRIVKRFTVVMECHWQGNQGGQAPQQQNTSNDPWASSGSNAGGNRGGNDPWAQSSQPEEPPF